MKLIKNAHIITCGGDEYKNGVIAFDEKIRYIGNSYSGRVDEEIDALGNYVIPGLIDAHCHVGLFGDALGFEGADANEDNDPITPQLRAIDGINPQDRAFADARAAGITAVVTGPGSSNAIGGQFAAIKTSGICIDEMIIKAPCAMKMALGENPKTVYTEKDQAPSTRMGTIALIRETLYKAKNYLAALKKHEENPEDTDRPDYDIKLETLLPVLTKEIPVKFHAHRADDICSAIRLGKEFDLDFSIEHCSDGDIIDYILERERVPVNIGPTLTDRSKPELKNLSFKTYKNLSDRGLSLAIITDHPEITIENLPLCSALAAENGMDKTKALYAITINAAKNCGIADRVGSLEPGKDADIAIYDKLPTEFGAKCIMAFINGETAFYKEDM